MNNINPVSSVIDYGQYGRGGTPTTTSTKTTTTKKKFDKDGNVVSETTKVVEESVTTYNYPLVTYANVANDNKIKYGHE